MKLRFQAITTQIMILAGLTAALLFIAFLYYSQQKKQFEVEISKQLWAISEMKNLQINDWRRERLSDAYFISHDTDIINDIHQLEKQPSNERIRENIREWMEVLFQNNQYAAMAILSKDNRLLVGTDNAPTLINEKVYPLAAEASLRRNTVFSDIYEPDYGKTLIYLAIPIIPEEAVSTQDIVTVLLIINPYANLFPMIQNWPYATKTAECILLKKVDDQLLNLNKLRFKAKHSHELSMKDRKSILRNFFERGTKGLDIKGIDYRNKKVYRVITLVPGFNWYLISKEDASEIMSDFNRQALLKILATFLLLISCTLGLTNIWTKQRENQLRSSLTAANEIMRLNRTYSILSSVDQAIVHTRDPYEIIRNTCRIAIEKGGFSIALYNELTPNTRELRLIHLESSSRFTKAPNPSQMIGEEMENAVPLVLSTGSPLFYNQVSLPLNEMDIEGRDSLQEYHSASVFPMKRRSKVIGLFYFIADDPGYFNEMEIKLIKELSDDLSYAMDYFDEEQNLIEAKKAIDLLNEQLENRVIERTTHLEAVIRELNAFSYSVSHDLRAPLRSISGFTEIIRTDYGSQLDEEGILLINKVQRNISKMGQLIDDLLAFSQVSKTSLKKVMIDMTQMVRESYENVTTEEQRRKITLELGELPYAACDATYINQVWQNLLENAVKFSSKVAHPVITIEGEIRKNETIFRIRDNGIGFEQQYAEKIFGTFERLHSESDFEGTGIGLALVKRIIQRHGGEIWAEGNLNKGATFSFTIPN